MFKYVLPLYVWLQVELGKLMLPMAAPVPAEIKFSCGWVKKAWDVVPINSWLNNYLGLVWTGGILLALVLIGALVFASRLRSGGKVASFLGSVIQWLVVIFIVVTITLPGSNLFCDPF